MAPRIDQAFAAQQPEQAKQNSAMTPSRRYQREEWFYKQREYPLGKIPDHARLRALQQIRQADTQRRALNLAAPAQPVQGSDWISIGPAPIRDAQVAPKQPVSGRIAAIAVDPFDPTHWFIGGAQGGVWETHDTGASWIPLTDAQASLAMGAIALAPSDPNIIYAGTGEANGGTYGGLGLLKSNDGGLTWQLLGTNVFAKNTVSDIKVHPTNPNLLLAATSTGVFGRGDDSPPSPPITGIYKSTDGGVTWSRRLASIVSDLEVDPSNFANQYAGISYGGISRSTDSGDSWSSVGGPWDNSKARIGRVELAIAPSSPSTLYVSIADLFTRGSLGIWRTDNAWDALPVWRQLQSPSGNLDQLDYNHDLIVDPANADILYFAEIGLWRFNGSFWTVLGGDYDPNVQGRLMHSDQHVLAWAANRLIVGKQAGESSARDQDAANEESEPYQVETAQSSCQNSRIPDRLRNR